MGESINIKEYILMFKKRKWIIMLILVLSIAAGVLVTYRQHQSYVPIYEANVRIRINTSKNTPGQGFSPAVISLNQNIATTYSSLYNSKTTLQYIINKLDLKITIDELASKINLTPDAVNAEFIDITAIDARPEMAFAIANAVPEAFNNELIRTIGLDCVVVIDGATRPEYPIPEPRSNMIRNSAIGGIVLSIFAVLLLEFLNNKVITPEDAEEYWGVPLIGVVPFDKPVKKKESKKKGSKNKGEIAGGELNGSKI